MQAVTGIPVQLKHDHEHDWSGPCYACCGDCDSVGCLACCLTFHCPCVAYGWNRKKAFGANAWLWGLLYALFLLLTVSFAKATTVSYCIEVSTTYSHRRACYEKICWICLLAGSVASSVTFALGFWNRTKLREKFDLPGSVYSDALQWLCCSGCSLCQETRTLMLNNVENGIWYGPAPVMAVPVAPGQPCDQTRLLEMGEVEPPEGYARL